MIRWLQLFTLCIGTLAGGGQLLAANVTWLNTSGNFSWNTTTTNNWSTGTPWINANNDGAIFTTTGAGTITLGSPITVRSLDFQSGSYTINGGGNILTLTSSGTSSLAGREIRIASGLTTTINAQIAGSAGLTKTGEGLLILGGVNTYTGTTSVNAGILELLAGSSISGNTTVTAGSSALLRGSGTISGSVTVNGGTNPGRIQGGTTLGTLRIGGNLTLNSVSVWNINVVDGSVPAASGTGGSSFGSPTLTTNNLIQKTGGTTSINTNVSVVAQISGTTFLQSYSYRVMTGAGNQSSLNVPASRFSVTGTVAGNPTLTGDALGNVYLNFTDVSGPLVYTNILTGNGFWHNASSWSPNYGPPISKDTAVLTPDSYPMTAIGRNEVGSFRLGGFGSGLAGSHTLVVGGPNSTGITCLNYGDYRVDSIEGASAANPVNFNLYRRAGFAFIASVANINIGTFRLDEGIVSLTGADLSSTAPFLSNGGSINLDAPRTGINQNLGQFSVQSGNSNINVTNLGQSLTFAGMNLSAGSQRGVMLFTGDQGLGSPNNPLGVVATNRRVFIGGFADGDLPPSVLVNRDNFAAYTVANGIQAAQMFLTGNNFSGGSASLYHQLSQSVTTANVTSTFTTRGLKIIPGGASRSLDINAGANLDMTGLILSGVNNYTIGGSGILTATSARYITVSDPNAILNISANTGSPGMDLVKSGAGTLLLSANNGTTLNTGNTRIILTQGHIQANPLAGGLPANPNVALDFRGGILELIGGTNGIGIAADFTKALGDTRTAGGWVSWSNAVDDRGSGGFSAFGADASVNIGGNAVPTPLRWGQAYFLQEGNVFISGSLRTNHAVTFLNPIQLDIAGAPILYSTREFNIVKASNENPDPKTVLAGIISGASHVDVVKTGNGVLVFAADNTYLGDTFVREGILRIGNGNNGGSFGLGNRVRMESGSIEFNRTGTLTVNQKIYSTSVLIG